MHRRPSDEDRWLLVVCLLVALSLLIVASLLTAVLVVRAWS